MYITGYVGVSVMQRAGLIGSKTIGRLTRVKVGVVIRFDNMRGIAPSIPMVLEQEDSRLRV